MPRAFDIIAVGGGLGGAALAWTMARHGASVLVLERERQFQDRVRGEAVLPWGTVELKRLGLYELLLRECGQEIRWFDISFGPTGSTRRDLLATTPQQTPVLTFHHPHMQECLLQAAGEAGAEGQRGVEVCEMECGTVPTVTVRGDAVETYQARMIVGADGRNSWTRQCAGFQVHRDPDGLSASGVLLESVPIPADTAYFRFNLDLGQMALVLPQRGQRVRAYVFHQASEGKQLHGPAAMTQFIEESIRAGAPAAWFQSARDAGPLATGNGAAVWVEHPWRNGVALVGDAAGSSDPTWGSGLSTTLLDVRTLCEQLRSHDDWQAAGMAYAAIRDGYYQSLRTAHDWYATMFMDPGPAGQVRRRKAIPRISQDMTRMPDLFALGPLTPVDETARKRFFGED